METENSINEVVSNYFTSVESSSDEAISDCLNSGDRFQMMKQQMPDFPNMDHEAIIS